jgi:hypothetical protein
MNRIMRWTGVGLVLFLCCGVPGARAQQPATAEPQAPSRTMQTPAQLVPALPVPRLVKFAGVIKDEQGKPRTGAVGVTLAIYTEQEGGAALWLETQNVEFDEQGRYTVLLGATKSEGLPLELFTTGEPRWLGVQVNLAKEVEQPRVLLVSVPYALKAADADTVGGLPASAFVLAGSSGTASVMNTSGTTTSANAKTAGAATAIAANFIPVFTDNTGTLGSSAIFQSGTNIGIGTTTPAAALHVNGDTLLVTSATTTQLQFSGTASEARFGEDGNGAFFASDTPGRAVRFYTNNGTLNEGLRVTSAGNVGIGTAVPGQKLEVAGSLKISGGGNALVFPDGTVMTSAGAGTNGGTITGVTAGTGLTGGGTAGGVTLNIASGGITNALLGANSVTNANIADGSLSPAKITGGSFATLGANTFLGNQSVVAMASGVTGLSVQTTDLASANTAVNGLADGAGGTGVIGEAENGSLAIGVWGISSSGVAGQFSGNVNVTGSLSKAGGSFKIDHPADPANKYLYHSFVESPDMKNIYDGVTNLDAQGEAVVQLPSWFGVLNKEFRYQLTCIGGFAPVYIAEEISENRFKIAGGKPGMKISWMVTGIRQDAWANAHRIPVEEEKPVQERGYYLHPELYGQPPLKSTEWATHQEVMTQKGQHPVKSVEPKP